MEYLPVAPFFPLKGGPSISVLLPTRGRPDKLIKAIDSCFSLAKYPSKIEIILKIDDDDKDTLDVLAMLNSKTPFLDVKALVGPRGNGYSDIHLWLNEMSRMSKGDWLFIFNDDARIETQHWDMVVVGTAPTICFPGFREIAILLPPTGHAFVWIRRGMFELLGHLAQDCLVDRWLYEVASIGSNYIPINVEVYHKPDEVMDPFKAKAYPVFNQHVYSHEAKKQKARDILLVSEYMERADKEAVWEAGPRPVGGWHLWDGMGVPSPVFVSGNKYFCPMKDADVSKTPGRWLYLD